MTFRIVGPPEIEQPHSRQQQRAIADAAEKVRQASRLLYEASRDLDALPGMFNPAGAVQQLGGMALNWADLLIGAGR